MNNRRREPTVLIRQVTQIAKEVFSELGSGHSEAAYQKAMEVGLRLANVRFEAQKVIELKYKNHYIGENYLDILARDGQHALIVELKITKSGSGEGEEQQLRNYMKTLEIDHGLLVYFTKPKPKTVDTIGVLEPEIVPIKL